MSERLQTITDANLLAAMDANFVEEMACFGRNLPGATLGGDEELLWFTTNALGFNDVLRCHNIYRRIGFQEMCTFDFYRWSHS